MEYDIQIGRAEIKPKICDGQIGLAISIEVGSRQAFHARSKE